MNLVQAHAYLEAMTANMEGSIDNLVLNSTKAQQAIYILLTEGLNEFDSTDGKFDPNQPIARKIQGLERRMYEIIEKYYNPSLGDYLKVYDLVDSDVIYLHKQVNDIDVVPEDIKNVRQLVYKQAETYLTDSLADAYVQPAKYLMMQTVTNGQTIKQAQSMLNQWNEGELPAGKLSSGVHAPRLQAYSGQIAADSLFQYSGTVQEGISKKYNLTNLLYVGDIIRDSRPACKYLVGLRRKINIDEIPPVLEKYPQGVIPNTTKANFFIYRCGYRCRHSAMPVR